MTPSLVVRLVLVTALLGAGAACYDPTEPIDYGDDDGTQPLQPGSVRCPFTTVQESLRVVGCGVTARGPYTAEIAVSGTRAYTTTYGYATQGTDAGRTVNIWDVSGTVPALLDTLTIPGAVARTSDVSISDDGALMVVSTEPAGRLAIYALNGTASPQLLALWNVPGVGSPGIHTAKLARVNGTLHLFAQGTSASHGVNIVDMSVPSAPRLVGRINAANYIHDVFVRDGLVFVADWDAGVGIWDIGGGGRGGTTAAPVLVSRAMTRGGNAHNVWWFHDPTISSGAAGARYLFVGEEQAGSVQGMTSAGDLHVVDIIDRAAPREVAIYRVPGAGAHNVWMDEERGILYAAFYNGGVRALDVRGDLSTCLANQRGPGDLCDLRLMGREMAIGLTTGGAFIWGVQFADDAVYASDMLNGIWKLQPVSR